MHGDAQLPMMSGTSDSAAEDVAREIERYLRNHREAADTVEGIAKWWLQRQRFEDAMETVESALEILVDRGLVERVMLPDNLVVYRWRE